MAMPYKFKYMLGLAGILLLIGGLAFLNRDAPISVAPEENVEPLPYEPEIADPALCEPLSSLFWQAYPDACRAGTREALQQVAAPDAFARAINNDHDKGREFDAQAYAVIAMQPFAGMQGTPRILKLMVNGPTAGILWLGSRATVSEETGETGTPVPAFWFAKFIRDGERWTVGRVLISPTIFTKVVPSATTPGMGKSVTVQGSPWTIRDGRRIPNFNFETLAARSLAIDGQLPTVESIRPIARIPADFLISGFGWKIQVTINGVPQPLVSNEFKDGAVKGGLKPGENIIEITLKPEFPEKNQTRLPQVRLLRQNREVFLYQPRQPPEPGTIKQSFRLED
jgi:hypothetical protein